MRPIVSSLFCALALPVGCSQDLTWTAVNRTIEADYPSVPFITTDSLATRLSDSTASPPVLLDARSPEEYAVSHLPGARRVAPDADSLPALAPLSRDTPIVVYCSVGYRSARVAARLQEQGFTNVANLKGSLFRWANEGRRLVRDGTPGRAAHPYDRTWGTLLADALRAYTPPESSASN